MTEYVEPGPLGLYSDAANRASNGVRLHIMALHAQGGGGRWCAIRMSDGDVSTHTFDNKPDCIEKHEHGTFKCLHAQLCCYLFIPMDDFNPRAAEKYIKFSRQMYDNGIRWTGDPAAGNREIVMPMRGMSVFTPLPQNRGLHVRGNNND